MANITCGVDCGNAPKMQFIKDFLIANADGDIEKAMEMLTEDVVLEIPGYETAEGKDEVRQLLQKDASRSKVTELVLENILSHGDRGSANGTLFFADGGVVTFCHMVTFSSHATDAKLKKIQTYSIVLK